MVKRNRPTSQPERLPQRRLPLLLALMGTNTIRYNPGPEWQGRARGARGGNIGASSWRVDDPRVELLSAFLLFIASLTNLASNQRHNLHEYAHSHIILESLASSSQTFLSVSTHKAGSSSSSSIEDSRTR